MMISMFSTILISTVLTLSPPATKARITTSEIQPLLDAIRMVESSDGKNLVGDGGKAIGPYQIHKCYWQDAVQFDPSIGGSYKDCMNRAYSERIVIAYLNRYATTKRIGSKPTYEDMARIHNGGPNGYKSSKTEGYWEKVEQHID
jgi:hypothetical protein